MPRLNGTQVKERHIALLFNPGINYGIAYLRPMSGEELCQDWGATDFKIYISLAEFILCLSSPFKWRIILRDSKLPLLCHSRFGRNGVLV